MNRRKFLQHGFYLTAGLGALDRLAGAPVNPAAPDSAGAGRVPIVMDTYEPLGVAIEEWQQGGINVVLRDVMNWKDSPPLELKVAMAPGKVWETPPPGMNIWNNARPEAEMIQLVLQGINEVRRHLERNPDRLALALTTEDVTSIVQSGRIAVILMIKSAWINHDLSVLETYYRLGVRVTALCHGAAPDWADSSFETNPRPGLTEFGRQVVRECNRLGLLVDLSHASDQTAWDMLAATTQPVIATHAQCRVIVNSTRSTSDDLLRATAKNGGLTGIIVGNQTRALEIDELDHAVKISGIDHVGVCSHSVGLSLWTGVRETLRTRGYGDEAIAKVLGGNFLRIFGATMGKPASGASG